MIVHHCKILPLNQHSRCVVSFLGGTEYYVLSGDHWSLLPHFLCYQMGSIVLHNVCRMPHEWNKHSINPQRVTLATQQVLIIHKNKSIFNGSISVLISKENPRKINVKILILIISGQSGYMIFTFGLYCIFKCVSNHQKTLL